MWEHRGVTGPTADVLLRGGALVLGIAGMFIGLGRFRPEKGGTNGRFQTVSLKWQDNRQLLAA